MILVKRNSTEFKLVEKLIKQYVKKKERKKLIKLYALKPGEKLDKKILLNSDEKIEALYDINYESIMSYLGDETVKLYRQKEEPLYYFKSSSKSSIHHFPFEFAGKLKQLLFPLKKVKG